jgi:hypothetical protein
MKSHITVLLLLFILSLYSLNAQDNLPSLTKKVRESIVSIITYNEVGAIRSRGTGFILNPTGNIVTNKQVFKDADSAEVKYQNGEIQPVTYVVGENRESDIIIISTKHQSESSHGLNLSSSPPEVGEHIVVVSSPLADENAVFDGTVSSLKNVPEIGDIIEISTPLLAAYCGSPVINLNGEVIGVASTQYIGDKNINFAIPSLQISKSKILQTLLPYETYARHATIIGNFDGDGKNEIAWMVGPKIDTSGMDCIGECECTIEFSNPKIEPFYLINCLPGDLKNEGDLDGDGTDEISIVPGWFTSAWRSMYLISFKNGQMQQIIEPFTVYVGDDFNGKRIMPSQHGYVTIVTDRWNDDNTEILHEKKEVKLK